MSSNTEWSLSVFKTSISQNHLIPECSAEVGLVSQKAIGVKLIATAAAANRYPLVQNVGIYGLFDLIGQIAGFRGPPYAFNNSPNALSDVLGLTAAIVSSRLNSTLQLPVNGTACYSSKSRERKHLCTGLCSTSFPM